MATRKKSNHKASTKRKSRRDFETAKEPIDSVGMFFATLDIWLKKDSVYWFRGHARRGWTLKPSALRHDTPEKRNRALNLLADFKRYAELKLPNPPRQDEELKWVQLARHYGLHTRLLDWTGNAAVALYFACEDGDNDGAVYTLQPKDLNRAADIKSPRIFDAYSDANLIKQYLTLSGARNPRGLRTIAINPVWNSQRIMLQQGAFTLHGSREFALTYEQAPSIVRFIIPRDRKQGLREELERAGINEMSIFPEAEHICSYLIWREQLGT